MQGIKRAQHCFHFFFSFTIPDILYFLQRKRNTDIFGRLTNISTNHFLCKIYLYPKSEIINQVKN